MLFPTKLGPKRWQCIRNMSGRKHINYSPKKKELYFFLNYILVKHFLKKDFKIIVPKKGTIFFLAFTSERESKFNFLVQSKKHTTYTYRLTSNLTPSCGFSWGCLTVPAPTHGSEQFSHLLPCLLFRFWTTSCKIPKQACDIG